MKTVDTIGDYNSESGTFWKTDQRKLSKSKAEKIVNEAVSKYLDNPLNKSLLDDMINIYSALNENQKADLCSRQKELINFLRKLLIYFIFQMIKIFNKFV